MKCFKYRTLISPWYKIKLILQKNSSDGYIWHFDVMEKMIKTRNAPIPTMKILQLKSVEIKMHLGQSFIPRKEKSLLFFLKKKLYLLKYLSTMLWTRICDEAYVTIKTITNSTEGIETKIDYDIKTQVILHSLIISYATSNRFNAEKFPDFKPGRDIEDADRRRPRWQRPPKQPRRPKEVKLVSKNWFLLWSRKNSQVNTNEVPYILFLLLRFFNLFFFFYFNVILLQLVFLKNLLKIKYYKNIN